MLVVDPVGPTAVLLQETDLEFEEVRITEVLSSFLND